ncbi:MAG: Short-chain dehydrogenase, associated with 2-hydroxychromene-2-carboxylate isomerase family protein [uncultured Microvirga sp.]|uniref:Short-chain dehydrogenase, associated with 2-hydroxychromene-2-carboxylate isomerase family protein n=1 Tax=uncultured Microvirga sp. TaxID=412392 RepID=A0A6J4KZV1_9HYPH|nr:MAG: Short-chain dehydrogenase, associated with 2-hydroxychromene-2-carboxylate isomerase family protein [uncultured Microvirga sp.]
MIAEYKTALVVGAGDGLSASLARLLAREGLRVALAARDIDKLARLKAETGAVTIACDVAEMASVASLFGELDGSFGAPDVVIFNPSRRTRGPFVELDRKEVAATLQVSAYGGFLVAQEALKRMLPKRSGVILFTGASASVKGYAESAPFAMAKFALRGLAQSLAREFQPQGIHIGHVVIDGAIRNPGRAEPPDRPDSMLDPDAVALAYLGLLNQHRSAWSWEIEVRPWTERF